MTLRIFVDRLLGVIPNVSDEMTLGGILSKFNILINKLDSNVLFWNDIQLSYNMTVGECKEKFRWGREADIYLIEVDNGRGDCKRTM